MESRKFREQGKYPKLGMCNFSRWFIPYDKKGLTDVDMMVQSNLGNRFVILETKRPYAPLPVGQRLLMQGFAKLPGCESVLIVDPYADDASDEPYPRDLDLEVTFIKPTGMDTYKAMVDEFNLAINDWFRYEQSLETSLTDLL